MQRWLMACAAGVAAVYAGAQEGAPKHQPQTVTFAADTSQVPQLQPWGRAAEALCTVWYPKLVDILASDDTVNFKAGHQDHLRKRHERRGLLGG